MIVEMFGITAEIEFYVTDLKTYQVCGTSTLVGHDDLYNDNTNKVYVARTTEGYTLPSGEVINKPWPLYCNTTNPTYKTIEDMQKSILWVIFSTIQACHPEEDYTDE